MKELCKIAGISKQALWSHNKREQVRCSKTEQVIAAMNQIRKDHKRMGSRRMYFACNEIPPVGRDIFERIGLEKGFRSNVCEISGKQHGANALKYSQTE